MRNYAESVKMVMVEIALLFYKGAVCSKQRTCDVARLLYHQLKLEE
jgi:hypothetical protein